MDPNIHAGHRGRLRYRYEKEGLDTFEDHNVLELLLFYAFPRCDTNELAHKLLAHCGSLSAVFRASPEKLMEVPGIGPKAADLITLVAGVMRKAMLEELSALPFRDETTLGQYLLWYFRTMPRSTAAVLLLDKEDRLLDIKALTHGKRKKPDSLFHAIIEAATERNVSSIYLAHNHADGRMVPSVNDTVLTDRLKSHLGHMGISLRGHFIICGNKWILF